MKRHFFSRHMFYNALIPAVISSLALGLANIADAVTVGNRIGEAGLATIGIVMPVYMIYNIFGYGLATGASLVHVRLMAAGKEEEAKELFSYVIGTAMLISVIVAVLGNVFMNQVLSFLGAGNGGEEMMKLCKLYARPLFTACPIFTLNFLFYSYLRSDDDPYLAGLGFTVGNVMDVVLNIVLVLLLHHGVSGAILATVTAQLSSVLIMLVHFFGKKGVLRLTTLRIGFSRVREPFTIGLSTSIRFLFQFLYLLGVNNLLMRSARVDGEMYVAVFDVVMNVSYVAYSIYEAVGDAIQPLTSAFYEERDSACLKDTLLQGLIWGIGLGSALVLAIAVAAPLVARVFGVQDPVSVEITASAIRWFCVSCPFAGASMIFIRFYQSVGMEKLSAVLTGLRTALVLFPVTALLGLYDPSDIWRMFAITEVLSFAIGAVVIVRHGLHKRFKNVPVVSFTMENSSHEIGMVMDQLGEFFSEHGATMRQVNTLTMAAEEVCMTTIEKAFTGREEEYVQITAIADAGKLILHIRNSAPRFNPLDMQMGKVAEDADDEILDSIGILAVKRIAKEFYFRRNDSFNMLTVTI